MKLIEVLLFSVGFVMIVLLVSCQSNAEPILSMTTPTTMSEQTQIAVTVLVATPSATIATETTTPLPTLVTLTSITVISTPMPSQTPIPTETVIPTLLPDEAVKRVVTLLADNQNPDCLLPCWWGAVPGQTYWYDYDSFLKSFALEIDDSPEKVAFATFPVPENIDYLGELNIAYRISPSKIITAISIASINVQGYDPQTMMVLYGVPDEVWLKTFGWVLPGNVLPFQLIIVYQEQGISFRYYVDASSDGETVTVCFEPGVVETERPDLFPVGPRFYLWEPGQSKTIDEIANISEEIYYPLEEKTDLTPQTLYEKFTNPNESPCIDTPAALWDY